MIVQKYGGSSLATPEKIIKVAKMIDLRIGKDKSSVVVVSAMGDTTDDLARMGCSVSGKRNDREMDMLLSSGEQISAALLVMALETRGIKAKSLNSFQLGILTDGNYANAGIIDIDVSRMKRELQHNRVLVVTGFQGIAQNGDITTLGRGGSDTTAVAIASVLSAPCFIYSDVEGIFTCDPQLEPRAKKLEYISYDEMLELSRLGARVLNSVAVETARKKRVEVSCCSAFSQEKGTSLVAHSPKKSVEFPVTGLAFQKYVTSEGNVSVKKDDLSLVSAVGYFLGKNRCAGERFADVLGRYSGYSGDILYSRHSISAPVKTDRVRSGIRAVAQEFNLV